MMKISKLIENLQAIHEEYGDLDCTISNLEYLENLPIGYVDVVGDKVVISEIF